MTKPLPKPKIEQLMSLMGYEFVKVETGALKGPLPRQLCISVECQWDTGDETDIYQCIATKKMAR